MIIEKELPCHEAREREGAVCQYNCPEETCPRYPHGCEELEWIEEWDGSNPCPTCGQHARLLVFADGKEEYIPCQCENN